MPVTFFSVNVPSLLKLRNVGEVTVIGDATDPKVEENGRLQSELSLAPAGYFCTGVSTTVL
jgi:hypothetical protein